MSPLVRQGHIGSTEAIVMTATALAGKLLYIARTTAQEAAMAGWMLPLLNTFVAGFLFYLLADILDPDAPGGVVEQYERRAGFLGTLLLASVALDLLLLEAFAIRQFGSQTHTIILPATPVFLIEVIAFAAITYAVWLGIEALGRASMLYGVPMALTVVGILGVALMRARFVNLLPLLGYGLRPIIHYGVFGGFYREVWVLVVIWTYLREPQRLVRIGFTSFALVGGLQTLVVASALAVVPMPATTRLPFLVAEIARAAHFGQYLSNLEAVFTFLLGFIVLLAFSLVFWTMLVLVADLLRIPNYRQLIPILALGVMAVSLLPKGMVESFSLNEDVRLHGSYVAYPLLLLVWIVSRFKRRKKTAQGGPSHG